MKPDTHKIQPDPAEGSRETVEKQLKQQEKRQSEQTRGKTDRPGADLGGAEDRSGGSATNPVASTEKGRGETGRASGYAKPSGSR